MAKLKGAIPSYSGIPGAIKKALGPVSKSKSGSRSSAHGSGGKGGLKVSNPKPPKYIPLKEMK